MSLRELTVEEYWQLMMDTPLRLIPPIEGQRPVRDATTNQIRYIAGPLQDAAPNKR